MFPSPSRCCPLRLELVLEADLELALVVEDLPVFLERRGIAAAGAPCRIGTVEPVEHVERLEVDRRFVAMTPRHLEGFGDAQIEPLVADGRVREVNAGKIRWAAAGTVGGRLATRPWCDEMAEGGTRRKSEDSGRRDAPWRM